MTLALPTEYEEIPGGDDGTLATLQRMAQLAEAGPRDPQTGAELVWWARAIVRDVPSKDYVGELRALLHGVRELVRYRLDPNKLERVQTPYWTLAVDGQGDCDDMATLLAALALALGHGAILRAVCVDPERLGSCSHVYPLLGVVKDGQEVWLAADATQKGRPLGWQPPKARWSCPPMDILVARP